jgi:pyruvate dehydrogenase E1 component alpha subunit
MAPSTGGSPAGTGPERAGTPAAVDAAGEDLWRLTGADVELLVLIRRFEQTILELFSRGLLNGTTHTCLGEEYVPVALGPLLAPGDFIFSNHRGHGHYLMRFADPEGLMAEIMGRSGAVCNGVGGSQHIHREGYLSTGVQGESLPVAAGMAWSLKQEGEGHLAVAFIGDGTWGEGSVYEALNLASLWQLPLVVVVENNGIAQTTPIQLNLAGTIEGRVRGFGIDYARIETRDIEEIRARIGPLVLDRRRHPRPLVIEVVTARLGPHSKGDDTRDPELVEALRRADWYPLVEASHPETLARAEAEVGPRLAALAEELIAREPSRWSPCGTPTARGSRHDE